MKKRSLLALLLAALLAFTFASCGSKGDTPKDTAAPTGAPTEASTEAPTEAEKPTEAPTETPTEAPETEAPTAAETTEEDLEDPTKNPIRVGTSFDGKTPCYDGRLYLTDRDEWFDATDSYGLTGDFDSIQDAVDFLEGSGGNIMVSNAGDIGLCLSVNIPDDDCFYRIAYNWNNCDFVFNYGYTYDDGTGGYAYYSILNNLDVIAGLDGTHIFVWGQHDEFPQGYYEMHWVGNGNAGNGRNYDYEKICDVEEKWPGLPQGETYFE